jgi:hypothetical protein
MGGECPVECNEAEILDEALAQKQAVEGIARWRLGIRRGDRVDMVDDEKR